MHKKFQILIVFALCFVIRVEALQWWKVLDCCGLLTFMINSCCGCCCEDRSPLDELTNSVYAGDFRLMVKLDRGGNQNDVMPRRLNVLQQQRRAVDLFVSFANTSGNA